MENKTVYCSTKKFDGDDPVRTELTIDFSGVTEADLVEYAIDSLVIKWQGAQRRSKSVTAIPTKATYKMPKPGTRAATSLTPLDLLTQVFGKERTKKLVNDCGSVGKVIEALLDFLPAAEE